MHTRAVHHTRSAPHEQCTTRAVHHTSSAPHEQCTNANSAQHEQRATRTAHHTSRAHHASCAPHTNSAPHKQGTCVEVETDHGSCWHTHPHPAMQSQVPCRQRRRAQIAATGLAQADWKPPQMITRLRYIWCGEESENMKLWERGFYIIGLLCGQLRTTQPQPH